MYPDGDFISHDSTGSDCICGPDVELILNKDGELVELIIHHALSHQEDYE